MKAIVIGLGNPLLQDDGIGPYLAQRLEEEQALENVDYYITDESGMYLAEKLVGYDQALIIDALKTDRDAVGQVRLYTDEDFTVQTPISVHAVDLFAAAHLLRQLGVAVPHPIGIVAISVRSTTLFAERFSPAIEQRKTALYQEVYQIAKAFFTRGGNEQ